MSALSTRLESPDPAAVRVPDLDPTPSPSSIPQTLLTPNLDLPFFIVIGQSYIPTLQHVPKGVRDLWARALSDCLLAVVDDPVDLSQWTKVFMLAKCVLASPAAGHRLQW